MSSLTPEEFAMLAHDDSGSMLNAVMWSLVAFSAIFLALRVYCKRITNRALYWDDYMLLASWVCLVLDCAVWSAAIPLGYGKHSWDVPPANFPRIIFLAEVAGTFAIVACIWSKTAFAITLLRLSEGWMKYLIWFLMISMNLFLGLSVVFNWAQCIPIQRVWDQSVDGHCWPTKTLVAYHVFSGIWSAGMDLTLAILPWKLIWGLQMMKKEKLGIGLAMSMGIFACITALLKVSALQTLESMDIHDALPVVYFGVIEIATTIVGVSIPVLRVLIRDSTSTATNRSQYYKTDDTAANNSRRRMESSKFTNPNASLSSRTSGIEMVPHMPE